MKNLYPQEFFGGGVYEHHLREGQNFIGVNSNNDYTLTKEFEDKIQTAMQKGKDNNYLDVLNNKKKEIGDNKYNAYLFKESQSKHRANSKFDYMFLKNKEINFEAKDQTRILKQKDEAFEKFVKDGSCVKEIYQYSNPNYTYNSTNEDFVRYVDKFHNKKEEGLFLIFDGYSGYEVADYCINRFYDAFTTYLTLHEHEDIKNKDSRFSKYLTKSPKLALEKLKLSQLLMTDYNSNKSEPIINQDSMLKKGPKAFEFNDVQNILIKAFKKIDFETELCNNPEAGASGIAVYFTIDVTKVINPNYVYPQEENENKSKTEISKPSKTTIISKSSSSTESIPKYIDQYQRVIYICNIGKCRCVLVSSIQAKRLSFDHVATDRDEIERIVNSGGVIMNNKIGGKTELSRAIGDHSIKRYGLISTPSVTKHLINYTDKFLVIGSGGIWAVIRDDDLYRMSPNMNTAEQFGKAISTLAISRGAKENLSLYVLRVCGDYLY